MQNRPGRESPMPSRMRMTSDGHTQRNVKRTWHVPCPYIISRIIYISNDSYIIYLYVSYVIIYQITSYDVTGCSCLFRESAGWNVLYRGRKQDQPGIGRNYADPALTGPDVLVAHVPTIRKTTVSRIVRVKNYTRYGASAGEVYNIFDFA